jgi:hypothetical protein
MEPIELPEITLNRITHTHNYRKIDNRRKKDYRATLHFDIHLYGTDLKHLPMKEMLGQLREKLEASITWKEGTEEQVVLHVEFSFPADRPSEIRPEEELLGGAWAKNILRDMLDKDFYQPFLDETNRKRSELVGSYRPVLENIWDEAEKVQEALEKRANSVAEALQKNGGRGAHRILEWDGGDLAAHDLELTEWFTTFRNLQTSLSRAENLLEAFEQEIDRRVEDLCWENSHNSTSILHNALSYVGSKVKRHVLKVLRARLRRLQREAD